MLRHEVEQAIDGLDIFSEHMNPVYQEISHELCRGLAETAIPNSLENIQQAERNEQLLSSFVDLLPQAQLGGKAYISRTHEVKGYNDREHYFAPQTPEEVRWLQKSIIWSTPMSVFFSRRQELSRPYYLLGQSATKNRAKLLLVAADKPEEDGQIREIKVGYVRKRYVDTRQTSAREQLTKPIDDEEMQSLYVRSTNGERTLRLKSSSPNTQNFYDKNFFAWPVAGLFSLYTSPLAKAVHPYGIRLKDDFIHGVYDSDLGSYRVFERLNELATCFGVTEQTKGLLSDFAKNTPAFVGAGEYASVEH